MTSLSFLQGKRARFLPVDLGTAMAGVALNIAEGPAVHAHSAPLPFLGPTHAKAAAVVKGKYRAVKMSVPDQAGAEGVDHGVVPRAPVLVVPEDGLGVRHTLHQLPALGLLKDRGAVARCRLQPQCADLQLRHVIRPGFLVKRIRSHRAHSHSTVAGGLLVMS